MQRRAILLRTRPLIRVVRCRLFNGALVKGSAVFVMAFRVTRISCGGLEYLDILSMPPLWEDPTTRARCNGHYQEGILYISLLLLFVIICYYQHVLDTCPR
jgi:hypothetical protein